MKHTLYLLKYNNYYNRTIKQEETLQDYLNIEGVYITSKSNINFNPNDGVNTTCVMTFDAAVEPDYLLAYDQEDMSIARWFIIEQKRTTGGQWHLTLRRDLIADFLPEVSVAPSFIEKATLNNAADPAVYNNEAMSFNQIKTAERTIQDETRIPWIVGYVPRKTFTQDTPIAAQAPSKTPANIEVSTLSSWEFGGLVGKPICYAATARTTMRFINSVGGREPKTYNILGSFTRNAVETEKITNTADAAAFNGTYVINGTNNASNVFQDMVAPLQTTEYEAMFVQWLDANLDTATEDRLNDINGKILKTTDNGALYRINVSDTAFIEGDTTQTVYNITSPTLTTYATANFDKSKVISGGSTANTWKMEVVTKMAKITLEQIFTTVSTTIVANHNQLLDAPYDMFCIPYGSIATRVEAASSFTTNKEAGLNMANAIVEKMGSGAVFDLQLLPYCPCRELLNPIQGTLDAYKGSFSAIQADNSNKSVIIWCQYSQFSFTRTYSGGATQGILWAPDQTSPIEKKIENETTFNRICSPNYDGVFEFTPAKNNGFSGFNIDCVYRPFTPYIHINPIFNKNSLYGGNYGDARGLICGGDFSLTQMTDAWATYQLNNKNYQRSFDRQIENIETTNNIQRQLELIGGITGIGQGAVTGGLAGGMTGNPIGAGIGAGAGAALSGAGMAADLYFNEQLRNEALDYTKDQFGYSLGNIQAQPQSLTKVSSLNPNNKIFPFVEVYSCSEIEKQALRDKIRYNGMTVMRIGTIGEFIQTEPTYIKARLIRLEDIGDFHCVSAIADELNKGIFI